MLRPIKIVPIAVVALICAASAFESPSEQVGVRACSRLALRLVDCLLDACDFYVHRNQFNIDTNDRDDSTRLMGAIRDRKWQVDVEATASTSLADYLRTTRPMDWTEPARDCWLEAIKWLRNQLFAARLQLLAKDDVTSDRKRRSSGGVLAGALATFGQLAGHLRDVCRRSRPEHQLDPSVESIGRLRLPATCPTARTTEREVLLVTEHSSSGANTQLALEFVREVVEILGELYDEASERQASSGRAPSDGNRLAEKWALDAIKRHYAYLTQVVTSFDLIFESD